MREFVIRLKNRGITQDLDLFFLTLYIFFLPIAHVATIQAFLIISFLLVFFKNYYKTFSFRLILYFKSLSIAFLIFVVLAFLSLFNTPDKIETLKEIEGELLKNLFFFLIFLNYAFFIEEKKLKKLLILIGIVLFIHGIINLIIWVKHGGFPFRAGGLLDTPGGERFGIWITYILGLSFGIFKYYSKYGVLLIIFSFINIAANQTRATFVALILIILCYIYFFTKNRKLQILLPLLLFISVIAFYSFSDKLPPRYNLKLTLQHCHLIFELPPKEFDKIPIDPSIYTRLSMWKSAILYRLKEPFIPQEYGRFLFKKSILEKFENQPQKLPTKLYPQAHNEFIGILYGLGVIGLIVFCYVFYYKLKIAYKFYYTSRDVYTKIFSIFVFLGTIGFIGSLMFGSFFGDSEVKFFYFLYGLLLGSYLKKQINKILQAE